MDFLGLSELFFICIRFWIERWSSDNKGWASDIKYQRQTGVWRQEGWSSGEQWSSQKGPHWVSPQTHPSRLPLPSGLANDFQGFEKASAILQALTPSVCCVSQVGCKFLATWITFFPLGLCSCLWPQVFHSSQYRKEALGEREACILIPETT